MPNHTRKKDIVFRVIILILFAAIVALVVSAQLLGPRVTGLPLIGKAAALVSDPPGTYIAAAIALLLLLLLFLPGLLRGKQEDAADPEAVPEADAGAVTAAAEIPAEPTQVLEQDEEEDIETYLAKLWRDAGIEDDGSMPTQPVKSAPEAVLPVTETVVPAPVTDSEPAPEAVPQEEAAVSDLAAEAEEASEAPAADQDWTELVADEVEPVQEAAAAEEPVVQVRPKPLLYKPFVEDEVPEVREYIRYQPVPEIDPVLTAAEPAAPELEVSPAPVPEAVPVSEEPDFASAALEELLPTEEPLPTEDPMPIEEPQPVETPLPAAEPPKPAPRRSSRITIDTSGYAREDWRSVLEALKASQAMEQMQQSEPQDELEMDFADMFDWNERRR